jgi:predicted nucleic acid-binding Zn ribbon protein
MPPEFCPNCGAEVPSSAKACPECGADEQTGWSDRAHAHRLGIPDDEFDYDEFINEEFGKKKESRVKPSNIRWLWWVVAIGVLLAVLTILSS